MSSGNTVFQKKFAKKYIIWEFPLRGLAPQRVFAWLRHAGTTRFVHKRLKIFQGRLAAELPSFHSGGYPQIIHS